MPERSKEPERLSVRWHIAKQDRSAIESDKAAQTPHRGYGGDWEQWARESRSLAQHLRRLEALEEGVAELREWVEGIDTDRIDASYALPWAREFAEKYAPAPRQAEGVSDE